MKSGRMYVALLGFLLLAVPVLVVGMLTFRSQAQEETRVAEMAVQASLKDSFLAHIEKTEKATGAFVKDRLEEDIREVLWSGYLLTADDQMAVNPVHGFIMMGLWLPKGLSSIDPRSTYQTFPKTSRNWPENSLFQPHEVKDDENTSLRLIGGGTALYLEHIDRLWTRGMAEETSKAYRWLRSEVSYDKRDPLEVRQRWCMLERYGDDPKEFVRKKAGLLPGKTQLTRVWERLARLEALRAHHNEFADELTALDSELLPFALHLPTGCWDFFRVESLRIRGNDEKLPLAPARWAEVERERDRLLGIAQQICQRITETGRFWGHLKNEGIDFDVADLRARLKEHPLYPFLGDKKIEEKLLFVFDRKPIGEKVLSVPFFARMGGVEKDLSEHVAFLTEEDVAAGPAGLLFTNAFTWTGQKPGNLSNYLALRDGALAEMMIALRGPTPVRSPWVIGAAGICALLGFLLLAYVLWRERQLSHLRSQFVSNVSHELKTPVALMRLYAESLLLGRVPEEEKKKEYLNVIAQESERLTALVDNVLDFGRIEAGRKQYEFEDCDLAEIVEKVMRVFEEPYEKKGYRFAFKCGERPFPLRGDPAALTQIVFNLIDNAVKYSQKAKQREIHIELVRGDKIMLKVSDRGPGVPAEAREEVFEPFIRLGDEMRREVGGNGLGLPIVRHAARAHGGEVIVEDHTGGGATFVVSLPRAGKA